MVFEDLLTRQFMSGNLTGSSALANVLTSGEVIFVDRASTSDMTIISGEVYMPDLLSVAGDYNNGAATYFDSTSGLLFTGTSAQTISGNLTATSTLPKVVFSGSGLKTISSNASTSHLTVEGGAEVVVSEILSVNGNFVNAGEFTAGLLLEATGDYQNNGVFNSGGEVRLNRFISEVIAGKDFSGSATGTESFLVYSLATFGNYLFVGKQGNATACSQTLPATGCELMVFDVSDATNPVYVAGRDASGNATGTGNATINYLAANNNYLYLGKAGNATACSQTAGSAIGCELMVFDISSSTDPIYVAGRDASGSATGGVNIAVYGLVAVGNYLYVGKSHSITACSQTAGSAIGCEIMVFDVSSSTDPIYVAGRDASGSAAGTGSVIVYSLVASGNYLYLVKGGSAAACSQTAGSAIGCELMVFDISSSTNPIYVAGRDASGDAVGIESVSVNFITANENYLYAGKSANATACSQTAGFAQGCEIMVFDIVTNISGNLTGVSALGDLTTVGRFSFEDNASTTDLIIEQGSVSAPAILTVAGNYTNSGVFTNNNGEIILSGASKTVTGNLTGSSAFNEVTVTGSYTVSSNTASTTNLTIAGGGSLAAPSVLTIAGDYNNAGTFTHNSGEVIIENGATDVLSFMSGLDIAGQATGTLGAARLQPPAIVRLV